MQAFLLFFVLGIEGAQASIVNVLAPSVEAPEEGWTREIKVSVTLEQGNEDKLGVAALGGARWVSGPDQWLLKGSVERAVNFQEIITDRAFAHLRYRREFGEWAGFGLFQADHNAFRDLLLRDLAGVGVERRLWRSDTSMAAVATALLVEHEVLTGEQILEVSDLIYRNSTYVLFALQASGLSLASTTFFQPRVDDLADWRLLEELSLSMSLGEHLAWNARWVFAVDSRPPTEVGTWDSAVKSGLVFAW
jgi:hypothetical protein